jgi:tetratricopeptide (TPR) repeat protein
MHLANELLHELDTPGLSLSERTLLRCRLAKLQEQAGDYNAASEALAGFWLGVGERPNLERLDDESQAHVLLRVGSLTGWIGSIRQIEGSQEAAKDLISESVRIFEQLGRQKNVAEARSDLALCYWRAGAHDEARVILKEALEEFEQSDQEQRATTLLRLAEAERSSGRLSEALRIYKQVGPLIDDLNDHLLAGHYHDSFANVLNQLSSVERRNDYVDLALIEYAAASFHFEQAGHEVYQACVENNLGLLFSTIRKFENAHEHLDRAQMLMTRRKDNVHLAQVDETRARVLLAEGRLVQAEKTAHSAVLTLEKGEESTFLAEALITHGIALTQLHRSKQARTALERAISIAEQSGDSENAGLAALTLIEHLGETLTNDERRDALIHANLLVETTEDIGILRRATLVAFRMLFSMPPKWKEFSFRRAVTQYESYLIKLALTETNGSVSKASRLLGFKHHQSLISMLNTRHRDLIEIRSKAKKRRHHLIDHSQLRK